MPRWIVGGTKEVGAGRAGGGVGMTMMIPVEVASGCSVFCVGDGGAGASVAVCASTMKVGPKHDRIVRMRKRKRKEWDVKE
jgi:hypothetical protein